MLSILIPTYNHNVFPLVQDIQTQALREHIEFEVIVCDNASTADYILSKNQQVALIDNCTYILLNKNIGRNGALNKLALKAKYNWLLFLDATTMPPGRNFICEYLQYLNTEEKAVYGGIEYQQNKPPLALLLHWVYGRRRESVPATVREESPYQSFHTLNFAVPKSMFGKITFNQDLPALWYEDTLFAYTLSQKNIKVQHIHNPLCRQKLEESTLFLQKAEKATEGLKYLINHNLLPEDYIRLGAAHHRLRKLGLEGLAAKMFNRFRARMRKNLLGPKPRMRVFDLYRLGYLCTLK